MASENKPETRPENRFVLHVPLDASRVPDFTPGVAVRVLAWSKQGTSQQRLVRFGSSRKSAATFEFEDRPQESLRVALGPETATPFELQRLQTISAAVPVSSWISATEVTLPPMQISQWYWWWWQHWKQNFRITGRVVNASDVPIIGASVSAFDIDALWWWTAQERVGEATTDDDGSFAMEFTRASGWSPWWWWATRAWQPNPELVGRITAFVGQYAKFGALAGPTPVPDLEVFHALLAASPRPMPPRLSLVRSARDNGHTAIDPAALEGLRERLVEILPRNFPLPVWPWSAWAPWEDCGANLIFRVADRCAGETTVLLNESVSETRWEIPSTLDVTLTSRDTALPERRPGWTLVDYLFPASRSPLWNAEEPAAALARPA
jgi:hypothetical protein